MCPLLLLFYDPPTQPLLGSPSHPRQLPHGPAPKPGSPRVPWSRSSRGDFLHRAGQPLGTAARGLQEGAALQLEPQKVFSWLTLPLKGQGTPWRAAVGSDSLCLSVCFHTLSRPRLGGMAHWGSEPTRTRGCTQAGRVLPGSCSHHHQAGHPGEPPNTGRTQDPLAGPRHEIWAQRLLDSLCLSVLELSRPHHRNSQLRLLPKGHCT